MDDLNDTGATLAAERRQRLDLREIFDDVKALVDPFYRTGGASLEYWAAQAVREAYPSLDAQGLQIVVRAALRVCKVGAEGGLPQIHSRT